MKTIRTITFVVMATVVAWTIYDAQFWKSEALRSAATTLRIIRLDSISNIRLSNYRDTIYYWKKRAGVILGDYIAAVKYDSLNTIHFEDSLHRDKKVITLQQGKFIAYKGRAEQYEHTLQNNTDTILKHWSVTINTWHNSIHPTKTK
jgi:hypothetical protein